MDCGFYTWLHHLSPVPISQLPKTRGENGQGSVGLCVLSVRRAQRRKGNFGNFAVSSLCSLSFQGSLALEVLVITLATLVLLAGEIELSSPHPLWVLFPTSLPARGHLTRETQVFCLSRVRPREAGEDPVFWVTVADFFLPFCSPPSFFLSWHPGSGLALKQAEVSFLFLWPPQPPLRTEYMSLRMLETTSPQLNFGRSRGPLAEWKGVERWGSGQWWKASILPTLPPADPP